MNPYELIAAANDKKELAAKSERESWKFSQVVDSMKQRAKKVNKMKRPA